LRANAYNDYDFEVYHAVGLETLKRSLTTKPDSIIGQVHEALANWHGYNGLFSPDSVVYHSEKALEYYLKGDNQKKVADTYRTLSIDYINTRQLDKAQEVLFKSIEIYEATGDDGGLGSAFRSLGVLYMVMEDYQKSVAYTNKAVPLLEKAENYSAVAIAQFNLITGYGELGEFEKAYQAADYCLEVVRTKAPEERFVPIRAYSYRGEVYIKAKDYDNALKDYIAAWELCKVQVGEERCATYRTEIGQVYLLQENYKLALEHLMAGVKAYEDKDQNSIIQPYVDLAKTYVGLGNFEQAYLYQEKANANSQKILEDKVANLETEMAIKYETEKKDEAIASQAALIQQKSKTQNLMIAIAALLSVFLLSLLYFFNKNKKATSIIRAKNAENELLLKEIHHRVKNNLEMVKSLIALQSAQIEDGATKDAMIASQNRVQSMGIIHQKLYQGTNLGSIEMKDYFINLSEGILDTFNAEDQVKIECAMDNLDLDVDTAVPIGLIVNELLTNALKYAFPEKSQGVINISLEKTDDQHLKLKVQDNGIGKTVGLAPKGTGFGSQLVKLLTQQLNGTMVERTDHGTLVEFDFLIDTAA
jgi:two-component sensor histidine kinase